MIPDGNKVVRLTPRRAHFPPAGTSAEVVSSTLRGSPRATAGIAQVDRTADMGGMEPDRVTPRELDARLEAVEARTSERLGSIEANSKILLTTMTALAQDVRGLKNDIASVKVSNSGVKNTVIATGLALAALIVALYAVGFQIMDFIRSAVGSI